MRSLDFIEIVTEWFQSTLQLLNSLALSIMLIWKLVKLAFTFSLTNKGVRKSFSDTFLYGHSLAGLSIKNCPYILERTKENMLLLDG